MIPEGKGASMRRQTPALLLSERREIYTVVGLTIDYDLFGHLLLSYLTNRFPTLNNRKTNNKSPDNSSLSKLLTSKKLSISPQIS